MDSRIPIVDIHAHVNFAAYDSDYNEVLQRAHAARIAVVTVGTQFDTSQKTVDLAQRYAHVFSCIGLHPIHTSKSHHDEDELGSSGNVSDKGFTSRGEVFDAEKYSRLLVQKVIAVGECGLDYYRNDETTKIIQEKAFRDQLNFAIAHDRAVMLHVRPTKDTQNAYEDVLKILTEYKESGKNIRANVHCFTGSLEIAKQFVALGCTLSFTGIVTFAKNYDAVVRWVPADMFMVETDCPYLTPSPYRGTRNEPLYVRYVLEHIAKVREEDPDQLALQMLETNKRFFGVDFEKVFN